MKTKLFTFLLVAVLGLGIFNAKPAAAFGPPLASLAISGPLNAGAWLNSSFNLKLTADEFAAKVQAIFQAWADILGLSVETVKNGWAEGKTLLQIAQENNVTKEQIKANLQAKAKANQEQQKQTLKDRLQILVDQGVLTQTQADARLQASASSSHPFWKGFGFRGFFNFGWHHAFGFGRDK